MLDDAQMMTVVVTGLAIPIGDNWKLREGQCGDNAAMKSRGGNGGKKVVPLRAGPAAAPPSSVRSTGGAMVNGEFSLSIWIDLLIDLNRALPRCITAVNRCHDGH